MTTLMADLIAQQKREETGQYITEKAKQLLAQLLLPKQITGKLIEKYIKKAMRTGAWRKLPPQTKALLHTAIRFPSFNSHYMILLFKNILTEIELYTIRGKALYHGLIVIFKDALYESFDFLKLILYTEAKRVLSSSISYINKPLFP